MKIKTIIYFFSLILLSKSAFADPLVQSFKNPSFSGIGYSYHVLQVRAAEEAHAQSNANVLASAQAAAAQAASNTPLAKFISLFTSQVYAQIATQLSNNLFATGSAESRAGMFALDGNTISYIKSDSNVTLTVLDVTGNRTVVTVPIATFAF